MSKLLSYVVLVTAVVLGAVTHACDLHEGVLDIDHAKFNKLVTSETPATIIDVRSAEEYAKGHIPNAINLPHDQLLENISLLDEYKDNKMIFYCRSSRRAGLVTDHLILHGLAKDGKVFHLDGDMLGWEKAGLVVEK